MERDKLLGTMDAKVWTDEFMATKARLGNKEFDHTMMLSWFVNAIMAGFDEANRRAQRALDAEREKVKELEEQLRLANCDQVNTENDLNDVTAQLATLQAQVQAKDAEIAALKEHQKLHDRIFERQKLLLSHYAGTIKEAAKRLRYSTHSIEQPEPYNSRTPIVAAFLEQALGVNAEELEKERDTLTHANARLRWLIRQVLTDLPAKRDWLNPDIERYMNDQTAIADTEGQESNTIPDPLKAMETDWSRWGKPPVIEGERPSHNSD